VAVLLGLPSSLQLLQFVLKDVVIHQALPYDQKLPEASSVSFDRFLCILLPINGCRWEFSPPSWFSGGAHEVASTTSGWSLASYASLLAAPFFVGSFQVQFALFSVRPSEDGLSFCPVKAAWLILQVRGCFGLALNAIFFSWMRLCVFWTLRPSIAAFYAVS
jgi:hypothetical protein